MQIDEPAPGGGAEHGGGDGLQGGLRCPDPVPIKAKGKGWPPQLSSIENFLIEPTNFLNPGK